MEKINFVIGGKTGDLFHCLYSVRGLCEKYNTTADFYITDNLLYGGDKFHFSIDKTFLDLKQLIEKQEYISSFSIFKNNIQNFVNLNDWRRAPKFFKSNWTNILCDLYDIPISNKKWIDFEKNEFYKDKIFIHRSAWRFSKNFPWESIVKKNNCIFITSDLKEYEVFPYKNLVKPYVWKNFSELALLLNSCKLFIGNMSTPLALAHSMDVPRLAELYITDQIHYLGEEKIYKNFFYFSDTVNNSNQGLEKYLEI